MKKWKKVERITSSKKVERKTNRRKGKKLRRRGSKNRKKHRKREKNRNELPNAMTSTAVPSPRHGLELTLPADD